MQNAFGMHALSIKNLSKKYNSGVQALKSVSFDVEKGDFFALLGPNGAGKTTTINLLLGFLEPTSGEALINGLNVQDNIEASRSSLAYIPEQVSLYPELTGYENLEFFVKLAGKSHTSDFLVSCLEDAGLAGDFHNITTNTYSKGMRQKVGIAIAIAKQAKVLLLDEPLSGLDPKAANEFCNILKKIEIKEKEEKVSESTQKLIENLIKNKSKTQDISDLDYREQNSNRGNIDGSLYSSTYYNITGKETNYGLNGRSLKSSGKVIQDCNQEGIVVVRITVDRDGNVIDADPGVKGTTNMDSCLLQPALKTALLHKWNPDEKAPERQVGFVVINFKLGE